MVVFTPYVEEEKNKFTPYIEPPKFTAYEPEKPVFTPLKKVEGEQVFTPYFEPYDMTPPQIRDMAKIMGSVAEAPAEPVMGLEYIPAKVYSYLVEEPLANAGALVSQGLEKSFRLLGMDKLADTQAEVTETYKAPPITEKVKEQTAYLRQQAYKRGQAQGITYDITEAGTRFGSLLTQMGVLRKIPALKTGEIGKRFATLGIHGFLTTEGDLRDRLDAAVYRIGYAMTPFLAQYWGATGLKSIATDAVLNTGMTMPVFVEAYKQAKETGNWQGFVSTVVTQTFMNIGMALTTTGYPKAQRAARMKSLIKEVAPRYKIPYKDLDSIVKSFDKAQNPKTPFQKQALAKQETKLQSLMQKDNAEIELEKLAADEKNSPINKLIQQAEDNPATPNIQNKINNVAMGLSTDQQKARVHIRAKELGLLTAKDKEKQVYQSYMESLVGEKSTKNMNQGQIKMVIDSLDKMDTNTAAALSKTKVKNITPELLRFVTGLGELGDIGAKEKFRNPYEVFNKMGLIRQVYLPSEAAEVALYNDEMTYRTELKKLLKQGGIAKDSRQKVFDAIENPIIKTTIEPITILYHGSDRPITKFKSGKQLRAELREKYIPSNIGSQSDFVYFSESKGQAGGFAKSRVFDITGRGTPTVTRGFIRGSILDLSKHAVDVTPTEAKLFNKLADSIKAEGGADAFLKGELRIAARSAGRGLGTRNINLNFNDIEKSVEFSDILRENNISGFKFIDRDVIGRHITSTAILPEKAFTMKPSPTITKSDMGLNPSEIKLHDFAVKFFDDWANKLKLPPEKRRDKYVTHIFEKALTGMTDKGYIDPNILRAFEFGAIPKDIKNPFIHNERTGQEYGLKRDVVEAMNVYEAYALRTFHYEPLLDKISIYNKFLPELSRKYLGNYVGRMTNRPLNIDKGINNDIRALTKAISESPLAKAPAFKKLLPLLKDTTQGNIAGTAAYYYTGILYETALGMRPDSAIRNLGQGVLTICESGVGNYVKGLGFLTTKEGRDALHKSTVYNSRKYAYLPSQGGYIPQNILGNIKNAMMYMFKSADKFNVSTAFSTGYQEAKSLGLPDPICIERGDEVARSTQYMYTKMAAPEFTMTVPGKVLGVFTSWPRNWFELTRHWVRGDISEVYKNYEKMTGKKVYKEDWINRHRAAMMYAAIYALSMYIEHETDIKATQYTGFKSIETLPRYLSGNIAGLRLPLAVSQIAVGSVMRDRNMLKQGVKGINPTTWFNVLKKLDDIQTGKKDWLDMFFYRNRKRKFRLR